MILVAATSILAGPAALGVSLNQADTFQSGSISGWGGGSGPTVIGTGGPAGAGDRYLQISADAFKLGTKNTSQWTGNYVAAGINGIALDLRNVGPDEVNLRLMISGGGGDFASLLPAIVPADSAWHHYIYPLDAANLADVSGGGGNLASTLSNVFRVLLHEQAGPPAGAGSGDDITAILGLDNITAVFLPPPVNQWKGPGGGDYFLASSWTNATIPDAPGAVARFLDGATSPSTVTLSASATAGQVIFSNANEYQIAGPGSLILKSSGPGRARIALEQGGHHIAAGLSIDGDTEIDAGANTLRLTGPIAWNANLHLLTGTLEFDGASSSFVRPGATLLIQSGAAAVVQGSGDPFQGVSLLNDSANGLAIAPDASGPGRSIGTLDGTGGASLLPGAVLTATHIRQDRLSISAGAVAHIRPGGGADGVSILNQLELPGAAPDLGTLDLADNDLIVRYAGNSPYDMLRQWVSVGRTDGVGITASLDSVLAILDNRQLHLTDWNGQSLGSGFDQIILTPALPGDANLDGMVTDADLVNIIANLGNPGSWFDGDMDLDGMVSVADYSYVMSQLSPAAVPLGAHAAAVPEPSSLGLAIAGLALMCRCGRSTRKR